MASQSRSICVSFAFICGKQDFRYLFRHRSAILGGDVDLRRAGNPSHQRPVSQYIEGFLFAFPVLGTDNYEISALVACEFQGFTFGYHFGDMLAKAAAELLILKVSMIHYPESQAKLVSNIAVGEHEKQTTGAVSFRVNLLL